LPAGSGALSAVAPAGTGTIDTQITATSEHASLHRTTTRFRIGIGNPTP